MDIELLLTEEETGDERSTRLNLDGRCVIGRDADCDLPLPSKGISRNHFALESENGRVYVTDLSNNGTWLDGAKMTRNSRQLVSARSVITVPGYRIQLRLPQPTGASRAAIAVPVQPPSSPLSQALGSFSKFEIVLVLSAIGSFVLAWYELSF